jgi:hypothetical protein
LVCWKIEFKTKIFDLIIHIVHIIALTNIPPNGPKYFVANAVAPYFNPFLATLTIAFLASKLPLSSKLSFLSLIVSSRTLNA